MEEDFYIAEEDLNFSMKAIRFYFGTIGKYFPNYTKKLFWRLFSNPRQRKFTEKHLSFLKQGTSERCTAAVSKKEFYLHRFGSGKKKVLICHGWEGRTSDFKTIINAIIKLGDYQVLSIDFPGHGLSEKSEAHLPLFVDVISTVIETNVVDICIGHSLGAAAISMTVPIREDYFKNKKLIWMGLHPKPKAFFEQFRKITKIDDKTYQKSIEYAESILQVDLDAYNCHNYIDIYAKNEVLLIHDTYDKIINIKRIEQFATEIPNAQLFHEDHGRHFQHYKHPSVVDRVVLFIK